METSLANCKLNLAARQFSVSTVCVIDFFIYTFPLPLTDSFMTILHFFSDHFQLISLPLLLPLLLRLSLVHLPLSRIFSYPKFISPLISSLSEPSPSITCIISVNTASQLQNDSQAAHSLYLIWISVSYIQPQPNPPLPFRDSRSEHQAYRPSSAARLQNLLGCLHLLHSIPKTTIAASRSLSSAAAGGIRCCGKSCTFIRFPYDLRSRKT